MKPTLPVRARLDGELRLVSADPPIEALQLAAGAEVDGPIAPPQLAGVARIAKELGEAVSRLAHVATPSGDAQLWVRIEPDGDGFSMEIERWRPLETAGPRFDGLDPVEDEDISDGVSIDERLRITSAHGENERWFGGHIGQNLVRVVQFVEDEVLPGTGIEPETLWQGLAVLANDFGPRNRSLLARREDMQLQIDNWHRSHRGGA